MWLEFNIFVTFSLALLEDPGSPSSKSLLLPSQTFRSHNWTSLSVWTLSPPTSSKLMVLQSYILQDAARGLLPVVKAFAKDCYLGSSEHIQSSIWHLSN